MQCAEHEILEVGDQNELVGSPSFAARRSFCNRSAYVLATVLTVSELAYRTFLMQSLLTSLEI